MLSDTVAVNKTQEEEEINHQATTNIPFVLMDQPIGRGDGQPPIANIQAVDLHKEKVGISQLLSNPVASSLRTNSKDSNNMHALQVEGYRPPPNAFGRSVSPKAPMIQIRPDPQPECQGPKKKARGGGRWVLVHTLIPNVLSVSSTRPTAKSLFGKQQPQPPARSQ